MTAPDRTTWTVEPDPYGCPTIWDEQHRPVATMDVDIVLNETHRDLIWQVLTRVLAPDEATIERLAWIVKPEDERCSACTESCSGCAEDANESVRRTLAALADTSAQALGPDPAQARIDSIAANRAQARHTADDAKDDCPSYTEMTGGGEDG